MFRDSKGGFGRELLRPRGQRGTSVIVQGRVSEVCSVLEEKQIPERPPLPADHGDRVGVRAGRRGAKGPFEVSGGTM